MNCVKNILILSILHFSFIFSSEERIVTIGGVITEIVFALEAGKQVIAVDQSSTIPSSVTNLPQVGYIRSISSEGILSVMPTLIITSSEIGPLNTVNQLKQSGVEMKILDSPQNYNDIINLVGKISKILNVEENGKKIIKKLSKDFDLIQQKLLNQKQLTKIIFFMDAGNSGSYNAAGNNTKANYLIELIGGINCYKDIFNRYSKITSESIINMNPDVILIAGMSKKSVLRNDIISKKEFNSIKAVKNEQVHFIDLGYFLTFGTNISNSALNIIDLIDK